MGLLTKASFWHLFDNHLKSGGMYIIEDWGTGYLDDWPDGKQFNLSTQTDPKPGKHPFACHSYGMVGFVKELVDEQCSHAHTAGSLANISTGRPSKFASLLILPALVVVTKV